MSIEVGDPVSIEVGDPVSIEVGDPVSIEVGDPVSIEVGVFGIHSEADVFATRQRARETAAALGFDTTDQVRVATALSELGRLIVAASQRASVMLSLRGETLVIAVSSEAGLVANRWLGAGLAASARLMDSISVEQSPAFRVRMEKALPPGRRSRLTEADIDHLRADLARQLLASPMDELRAQNLELLRALEQLQARREELQHLNDELQETNTGVMAMYAQLSAELDETNRGVLALYAELDERGSRLREASMAKSRFLAAVNHELRSPLNSMLGLARLLADADSGPLNEEQSYQVHLIESSAQELLVLVNDLLDLARAEAGVLQPRAGLVDVQRMLGELRSLMRPITPAGVELIVEVPDDIPAIEADGSLLAQLVRNLVGNALKFTEAGEVRMTASVLEGTLSVAVADTGIGIAAEHQHLVFEEFFQVPGPLQARWKSTGLGLPYARRVAEALGGSLTLTSRPGAGSTFTATIPVQS